MNIEVIILIIQKIRGIEIHILMNVLLSMTAAVFEMLYGMLCKIWNASFTIKEFIYRIGDFLYSIFLIMMIINLFVAIIIWIIKKCKPQKEKVDEEK